LRIAWDFEVEHTFPKVGHKVLLLNARRLLLEEPPTDKHRILLAMEDITERRAAELQVDARLAFLRHLLDALPSSVYLVQGNDARLVLANQAAMRIWGAEWPIGQPLQDFLESHAITVCDRRGLAVPAARLATMRALQDAQPIADEQEVIHHADGTELSVLVNAVPFTDPELLTGLAATLGNGQSQAAEPAALVVHQQVQKLKEAKKTSSSGGAPANGASL
jgi:PAS domain-containing protein